MEDITTDVGRIITPKLTNRFRMAFYKGTEKLPYSDVLTNQIISTTAFSQLVHSGTRELCVTIEDDIENTATNALSQLINENFIIIINVLDGKSVPKESIYFNNVSILDIVHIGFNYAAGLAIEKEVTFLYSDVKIVTA